MLKKLVSNKSIAISQILLFVLTITYASHVAGQRRNSSALASSNRSSQQSGNDASTVYRSARDFITEGEWAKAQEKFNEYVSSFPNEKNLDAALYWLAYAQHKLANFEQVRSTVGRLLEKFPNTSWKDDARVLLAQAPGSYTPSYESLVSAVAMQAPVSPPSISDTVIYSPLGPVSIATAPGQGLMHLPGAWDGPTSDDDPCEFKIVVLQALFQTDVQRGIMAATEWLAVGSKQTVRCKSAALSLLGRHGGKAATPVILGVARNEPDVKLRARAISALAATNDDTVIDPLREFALNSQEKDIVEAAVYALSRHTGDRAIAVLTDIASSGKMIAQRKLAIASIATRAGEPAVDALLRIFENDPDTEIRKAVIAGLANRKSERAGNRLFDIARSSDNVELRKAAIHGISRRGGDQVVGFLITLYDSEKNEEVKDQIVNSLGSTRSFFIDTPLAIASGQTAFGSTSNRMEDERVVLKLIEIAKSPQAPMERRKRAIGWLSRSKHPAVLKFLEELLN
jgi:tetratricopeptide (TPR) repeat protein